MKSLSDFKPYGVMYVDAMNLMARSYHGMRDLVYKGKKTGMLYGVSRLFIDWLKKAPGIEIVMLWEGRDSWRKAKYPIYKANRGEHRSAEDRKEFWDCIDRVKYALPSMGITQGWCHTYEADDVVLCLAKIEKRKALFSSGDWDWWELADYGDILYQHKDILTRADMDSMFEKKYGAFPIAPSRLWLFKVLTGSHDNVSGIPRFPKKLAANLCNLEGVDETSIIPGLVRLGEAKWAERVTVNQWIIDRNLDLVRTSDVPVDEIEWVDGSFSQGMFSEILLKSGMENLRERFREATDGHNTTG